jgi:U3 small nucleolar RNA-associated protein 19
MSLLKHLSTSLSRSSPKPQFHVSHFRKVIGALLMCPPSARGGKNWTVEEEPPHGELDAEVRDMFVTRWLNVHSDVRWFFLRDAEYASSCLCRLATINKPKTILDRYSRLVRPKQAPMSPKIFSLFSRSSTHSQPHSWT